MNAPPPPTRTAWASLLVAASLAGGSASAAAAVRVVLGFDADGQRVHRVLHGVGDAAPDALVAGEPLASVTWLDAAGRTLASTRVADPRVGHVPAVGAGATTSARVALAEGAWLADGPDGASRLLLRLPAWAEPALLAEEWSLGLD